MNRRDFVSAFLATSVGGTQIGLGLAAQSAAASGAPSALWTGPVHMNDQQTFRLRSGALDRRAKALWPQVNGNRRLSTVLASAMFHLEMAETGMTNTATDELSVIGWVDRPLRQVHDMLDAVEAGKDYFAGKTGVLIKAYVSKLDGSIQPYVVQAPENAPEGKLPLVVVLHGYGSQRALLNWGDPKSFEPWKESYLRVLVYGRGWTRYKGVGGVDLWSALDEVRHDYETDSERTYLTGGSMGGAGTWYLATRSPGVFAAVAPLCGFTDYRLDYGSTNAKAEWEHRVYRAHDALTGAENLRNTPVYFLHGDHDHPNDFGAGVDVEHSRRMAARLKELRIDYHYDELPGIGHGIPAEYYRKAEQWLLQQRRVKDPRHVVLETSSLRYNRCYWLEVEGLREHFRESRIEATVENGSIEIHTEGITRFALHRSNVTAVRIDGQSVTPGIATDGATHFILAAGKWTLADGAARGMIKRHSVQGPWIDAYIRPALYVVPASAPEYSELAEYDLETYQRSHGGLDCSCVRGKAEIRFAIKKDRDVTEADIAQHHLLIFGDPQSNTVLARIHDRLPIRWSRDGLIAGERKFNGSLVGCKYIYPNPLYPSHYVTVSMGTRPEALHALRIFHWQIPDYLIFDERASRVGEVPYRDATATHQKLVENAYLAAGFFDEEWKLP